MNHVWGINSIWPKSLLEELIIFEDIKKKLQQSENRSSIFQSLTYNVRLIK